MEKVKINDICNISNGYAFKSDKYISENGARVIRITNVQKGKIVDNDPKFYPFSELNKLDAYKIFEGDILMSLTGNVGRVGRYPKELLPAYINQRVCRVMPKNEKLDTNFLFHFLNSDVFENEAIKNSAGAAQLNLSTKWLGDFEIPLPALATQQKIAAILDQADAIIQNNRAIVQKYDALTQSLFLDMFGDPVKNEKGWEMKYLGDLCDVGSSRRVFVDELVEIGIPFYRGTEIGQMSLEDNITPTLFITEEHYEKLKKETGVPKIGDLLMPSICPDGRIFEVTNDKPFYFKDGRVLWIKVNNEIINSVYLKKHLKAIFAIDYGKIASGTTFAELKIFALKKINLHYPPLKLQNQFAERVAVIEAQKQQAQLALAKSETLFQSLLQRAFKGELN